MTVAENGDILDAGKEIRYRRGRNKVDTAKAVREYITSHGIKQAFIAERCGWTKQKTSAIVRGEKRMAADELAAICEALGVPYDFFFVGMLPKNSA